MKYQKSKDAVTFAEVDKLFRYDPETGDFIRKITTGGQLAGAIAGYTTTKGYGRVLIRKSSYALHRLAWLLTYRRWPEGEIDHIDGNPVNNKIKNLREVTSSQNSANRKISSRNKSGYPGICWCKREEKWIVSITLQRKVHRLGYYSNKEDAIKARREKEIELFGEFSRYAA